MARLNSAEQGLMLKVIASMPNIKSILAVYRISLGINITSAAICKVNEAKYKCSLVAPFVMSAVQLSNNQDRPLRLPV